MLKLSGNLHVKMSALLHVWILFYVVCFSVTYLQGKNIYLYGFCSGMLRGVGW